VIVTNETTGAALVSLAFSGMTSPTVAAHIHGSALPGVNAPILFPLPIPLGVTAGQINDFAIMLTPTQLQDMKAGLFYFNVHTVNNPGGEIRGQIFSNPIDVSSYFVREQYLDFLNRNPDAGGQAFWDAKITGCGVNTTCISNQRIDVSAAFFIAQEFQVTDFYVYRVRKASFGVLPTFDQFTLDRSQISAGTATDKKSFTEGFVQEVTFSGFTPPLKLASPLLTNWSLPFWQVDVDLTLKSQTYKLRYLSELTQTASRPSDSPSGLIIRNSSTRSSIAAS
jgi:hypothetical protein